MEKVTVIDNKGRELLLSPRNAKAMVWIGKAKYRTTALEAPKREIPVVEKTEKAADAPKKKPGRPKKSEAKAEE